MFDYIIVGAGSAGCVMANRLSADPARRVCLIEAGTADRNPFIHMPLGMALMARFGWANWNYHTQPELHLNGRRLFWPRGKALGGSSSINAMIYARGHPADYAGWAAQAGADWGWPRVRDLFIALESNAAIRDAHHGLDGPLTVCDLVCPNPLSQDFVRAGAGLGYPAVTDFNGLDQEGVGLYQVTQKNGRRFSTARAFLDPVRARPNLTIVTGALVERVLFDEGRATGVRLRDREMLLHRGGEVILSAGAVNSPQLLMLSGIGPAAELARHGIAALHNAPEVGANLADHLDITVLAQERGRRSIAFGPLNLLRVIRSGVAWALRGQGELTSNAAEAGGFVRSDPGRDRPNLQLHFLPAQLHDHGRRISLRHGMTLHVCDLLPKSRGRIGLNDGHPATPARIEPNYLSHPDDMAVLLDGLKLARRIMQAPDLAQHITAELLPGPGVQSDADLIADIRARAETIYHPVGSCRMGRDAASVVDPAGRVRGVRGLRVVDASIMPSIIAGNTNAPTMMIAENIAQMMIGHGRPAP